MIVFDIGELEGEYFPLSGSHSHSPKPDGMTHEVRFQLLRAASHVVRSIMRAGRAGARARAGARSGFW